MMPEQIEIYKGMTGEEKLRTALNLYYSARRLKRAAISRLHPEWSEEQVDEALKKAFMYART